MEIDRHTELDTVHSSLRTLLADMIGPVALAGDRDAAAELAEMVHAVFGVDLAVDTIMSSPKPAGLASAIEDAWFAAGSTMEELSERLEALTEDE